MPRVELLAPRVRNLYQEVEHGRIFPVVHLVHPVLASGSAGGRALPHRLAHHVAVPHPWHRGAWRVCIACRTVFPPSASFAWSARDLNRVTSRRWGNLGVRRWRRCIFGGNRSLWLANSNVPASTSHCGNFCGNWKSCKMWDFQASAKFTAILLSRYSNSNIYNDLPGNP